MKNSDGTVDVFVSYNSDIQGKPLDIKVDPTQTRHPVFMRATPSSTNLIVKPDNNEAAYFYDPSVYAMANIISAVCTAISAVGGLFALLGIVSGKIIGV